MQIVPYPHPALRWKSAEINRIDDTLRTYVREMFRMMYEAKGIGLAANQVGLPIRLFVVNPSGEKDNPEDEVVFINPVIRSRKGNAVGEEGCLSLPNLYADVARADEITVEAFDLDGQGFRMKVKELPARVIQHELDHLDGVLFIDRLEDMERAKLAAKVDDLSTEYRKQQAAGTIPSDEQVREHLKRIATTGELPPLKVET
jgi:peptide deformylase